jgi:hypothetical protein
MVTWQKMENLPEGLQDLVLTALLEGYATSEDKESYWCGWQANYKNDSHMGDHIIVSNATNDPYFKVY